MSERDFVARVRAVAKEMTTLGQAFDMLHVADELERRDAKIERLLEAGTALWAFILVNSNEAITSHPQFNKVERDWNRVSYEVRHD